MTEMRGRRLGQRSRQRLGTMTHDDGTLLDDANPPEPGSDTDGDTGKTGGISITIGISL